VGYFITMLLFSKLLLGADLNWSSDYAKALIQAKNENKFVYVFITSDSCQWCRKFENTTLKDTSIKQRLEKEYVTIQLSRDANIIPDKFQTSPVPRHYFLDKNGAILYNTLGYRDVELMHSFMDNTKERYAIKNKQGKE